MTQTKKAISLILAVAMIFTTMLGCMTISASATEGRAGGEGPKLVDYSIEIANDTKTEEGAEFKINLEFDQPVKVVENWILSAFDITLSGGNSLSAMGFELKSGTVAEDGKTVVLDFQGQGNMPKLVSGEVEVSLKSNYYDAITDQAGELPVSEWVDVNTYVPTGLSFEKVSSDPGSEDKEASVTFKMNGPALLRGMSSVQILVNGRSITGDASGLVPIHTHTYIIEDENGQTAFAPVSDWVKNLTGNFSSENYTMTQGEGENADQFTITANAVGENADLEKAEVNLFAYSAPNDGVVQKTLFAEEIDAAKVRAAEIENSNSVAQSCKDALNAAITEAESVQPESIQSAIDWQKTRAALQNAVDGAQDNAITTTSATRSNGTINLSLTGGEEWMNAVDKVKVDGTDVATEDYAFENGVLKINSLVFDPENGTTPKSESYEITVEAPGYAAVTQTVTVNFYGSSSFTIRLLDKNDQVVEERTYSRDEIIAYSEDPEKGGKDKLFSTACSMTGSRAFKGSGAYLSTLIEDANIVEGTDFNPETTTVKFRTNDSNRETNINDDPSVDSYFSMINTAYTELMSPRYYFQDLYDHDSKLYQVYAESASVDQDDDAAVEAHNLKLRRAMAASENKVEVEPMIAYEFSEDPNVDLDDVPLSNSNHPDYHYDPALAKDKCFRFLLGTGMVEENGETLSSTLNTTMRATYQLYGIDLVDSSLGGSSGGSGGGGSATTVTEYTVTFDSNGGSSVAKQTVDSGKKISEPADPTREGYEFAGWYTDKDLTDAYDFDTAVRKSFTLYAKWNEAGTEEPDPDEEPGEEPGTDPGTVEIPNFLDVSANSWYAEYVNYLAERGIVNGKTATTFEPNAQITRAEFIKIIAEVAGADLTGQTSAKFSDVASGAWYAPYVAWGVENGLINGISDTQFDPNGNITRQDMATLISRYAGFAEFELPQTEESVTFTDASDIASYAKEAVSQMQKAGIINGRGDNTFAPKDNATRAEACKMLTILMQQMGR